MIQFAMSLAPVPPLSSRSTSANAPGAPVLPSGSVVVWLKHTLGQAGPLSSGCLMFTAIGATYCAEPSRLLFAVACACTVTELTPKSCEKNDGDAFLTLTVIESFRSE